VATARKKGARKRVALPERIMLDSGVVIRALEHANPARKDDQRVSDCRELWVRVLRECRVLMPPFVVLEVLAGDGAAPQFPIVRTVEHVAFSYQAAELMAGWAAPDVQKRLARETKTARRVVKYDALIVGTAQFHRADVLVTLDEDVKALAKLAGVRAEEPRDLLQGAQGDLFAGS
jgi:predicted nucleic acid-binding protein